MEQNKCEEAGFMHAWKAIENNTVYMTNPPQYPPAERICLNCGIIQQLLTKQSEVKEWVQKNQPPNLT